MCVILVGLLSPFYLCFCVTAYHYVKTIETVVFLVISLKTLFVIFLKDEHKLKHTCTATLSVGDVIKCLFVGMKTYFIRDIDNK